MSGRDPRINPRAGDVLDDDPGNRLLFVGRATARHVVAGRVVGGVVRLEGATWTMSQWRREMADAVVVEVAP